MFVTALLLVFCSLATSQSQQLTYCDFEEPCEDYEFDRYWIVNNISAHHDHTYGNLSGHYISTTDLGILKPSINYRTKKWIETPSNLTACLSQWFYGNQTSINFTIEIAQGDDLQARIPAGRFGSSGDHSQWTNAGLEFPYAGRFIPFVSFLNVTQSIDLDDISISTCQSSRYSPETVVLQCDFDRTLCPELVSLSNYSYSWSTIRAEQAQNYTTQAPAADYSVGDATGHYIWLNNLLSLKPGGAGYFKTRALNFTRDDPTFCLSFHYYKFGSVFDTSKLTVLAWSEDNTKSLAHVWPINPINYTYFDQRWSWAYAPLLIGNYSLLFRVDSGSEVNSSFAIDSIKISSCGYRQQYYHGESFLNFACDFDNGHTCGIGDDDKNLPPQSSVSFSFTTADRIRNEGLGPKYSSGYSGDWFLYWERSQSTSPSVTNGQIKTPAIETNADMCIRFSYFVNSSNVQPHERNIKVQILTLDNTLANIWSTETDDSSGWRLITQTLQPTASKESFYFRVSQRRPTPAVVAFDDITIDQCNSLSVLTTAVPPITTATPFNKSSSNCISYAFIVAILFFLI